MSSIAYKIDDNLFERLISRGNEPALEARKAFHYLNKTLYEGLTGNLEKKYYLSSIDTGIGKTTCLSNFISCITSSGIRNLGSGIIFFKTIKEIESFISETLISPADFACYTRDSALEDEGLGKARSQEARFLFTTQQMLRQRTLDRSFEAVRDFHYMGAVRPLRVFDESLILSREFAVQVDILLPVVGLVRKKDPAFADRLIVWLASLADAEHRSAIIIPTDISARLIDVAAMMSVGDEDPLRFAVDAFIDLAGAWKQGLWAIRDGGNRGVSLVGASRRLPDDLAPAIILDASGRVRTTYRLWEKRVGNLVRLPAATNDYSNLTIHLGQTAIGKDKLADPVSNRIIYRQIAKVMEAKAGEPWLVIGTKADDAVNIKAGIKESLSVPVSFEFLNWGRHHGTNEFRDIKNVLIVGSYIYSKPAYAALTVASQGGSADLTDLEDMQSMTEGELQHNILQAVMRGHARMGNSGIAGVCNVYWMASKNGNLPALLQNTFPGCQIEEWKLKEATLTKQQSQLILFVKNWFSDSSRTLLPKSDLRKALGIVHRQALTRLLDSDLIRNALLSLGVSNSTRRLYRH